MPKSTLYRLAAIAGVLSAALVLVNASRRSGVLPATILTRGIAPLAECFGLFALTGLYLIQRRETGRLGMIAYAVNTIGLAGTCAIDLAINYVFPYLDAEVVDELLRQTTGTMFLVVSVVFLVGVLLFGVATWRAKRLPAMAMALYVIGLVPVALRTVLPGPVANAGLIITAAGTAWLAVALWSRASEGDLAEAVLSPGR